MSVRQNSQNILILKDEVGKARRTTRDLPPKDFTYGRAIPRDPVGVQRCKLLFVYALVTSEWIYDDKS